MQCVLVLAEKEGPPAGPRGLGISASLLSSPPPLHHLPPNPPPLRKARLCSRHLSNWLYFCDSVLARHSVWGQSVLGPVRLSGIVQVEPWSTAWPEVVDGCHSSTLLNHHKSITVSGLSQATSLSLSSQPFKLPHKQRSLNIYKSSYLNNRTGLLATASKMTYMRILWPATSMA